MYGLQTLLSYVALLAFVSIVICCSGPGPTKTTRTKGRKKGG